MVTINLRFTNIYSVMSPAMMMPNPKKVTKIKKHFVCRSGGRGHVEHAFCVYFLDCRCSKLRRYSSKSVTDPTHKKVQNKIEAIGHH
jgi:hypothetical protein